MPTHQGRRAFIQDRLLEDGYVSSPFALSSADMARITSGFVDLVSELFENPSPAGEEIVRALQVSYPGQSDKAGFIVRRRIGDTNPYEHDRGTGTDNKDLFHYTPLTPLAVLIAYGRKRIPKQVTELVEGCHEVYLASRDSLHAVLEPFNVQGHFISPIYEGDLHVVRLLNYPPEIESEGESRPFDTLAETHFDRSVFTIAPWESSPGFYGAPGNNLVPAPGLTIEELAAQTYQAVETPLPYIPGEAKVFVGARIHYVPDEIRVKLGPVSLLGHGAQSPLPDISRQAIAAFVNPRFDLYGLSIPAPPPEECKFSFIENEIRRRSEV